MNPEHVRREVFILKTDFNYRLKTVYYEAIISVYYGTVVPVIFCKVREAYWTVTISYFSRQSLLL